MNIQDLIAILERRLVFLSQGKSSAEAMGDLVRVANIEVDMNVTTSTLETLKTLL